RDRRPARALGGGGEGDRRRAARIVPDAGGAARVLQDTAGRLQVSALCRLHRGAAAQPERQGAQARAARAVLGRGQTARRLSLGVTLASRVAGPQVHPAAPFAHGRKRGDVEHAWPAFGGACAELSQELQWQRVWFVAVLIRRAISEPPTW